MKFQRARNQKQIDERKKEITAACKQIYIDEGYDSITMEKISQLTSMSRPSIYNYYATKEEIVLELLIECYLEISDILKTDFEKREKMNRKEFSELLAKRLSENDLFLSIKSIHLLALESNCSQEVLNKIKIERRPFFEILHFGVRKFFPRTSKIQENEFVVLLTAMINGLYPITHLTEKQRNALKKAVPWYTPPDFYDICKTGIYALIHNFN